MKLDIFKNIVAYGIQGAIALPDLEAKLQAATFAPCGPTQQRSAGFVPPRAEHGAMVEAIGGHWIMKLVTESKTVPSQALNRRVDELAKQVEHDTGRKPGKKHRKELKEQALLELLPSAFPRRKSHLIWLDKQSGRLVIEAASLLKSDEIVSLFVRALDGMLSVSDVHTQATPSTIMTEWLSEGEAQHPGFSVDRECELKSCDEQRSIVRYGRHRLDTDNVREHLQGGKVATKLALTWQGRVSFVLTDAMQLRKVQFLDVVFEKEQADKAGEAFDANMAIATGELSKLIPDLIDALGGEFQPEQEGGEE